MSNDILLNFTPADTIFSYDTIKCSLETEMTSIKKKGQYYSFLSLDQKKLLHQNCCLKKRTGSKDSFPVYSMISDFPILAWMLR